MEILFKQLKRLTKVALVYGNHENKIKFTRNKLNQEIIKNNITILNDQEVHLNNIILIGRKDYNPSTKTYNIVLDHQSQGTKENIKNNIDLQLSGHTHNGNTIWKFLHTSSVQNPKKTRHSTHTLILS